MTSSVVPAVSGAQKRAITIKLGSVRLPPFRLESRPLEFKRCFHKHPIALYLATKGLISPTSDRLNGGKSKRLIGGGDYSRRMDFPLAVHNEFHHGFSSPYVRGQTLRIVGFIMRFSHERL